MKLIQYREIKISIVFRKANLETTTKYSGVGSSFLVKNSSHLLALIMTPQIVVVHCKCILLCKMIL